MDMNDKRNSTNSSGRRVFYEGDDTRRSNNASNNNRNRDRDGRDDRRPLDNNGHRGGSGGGRPNERQSRGEEAFGTDSSYKKIPSFSYAGAGKAIPTKPASQQPMPAQDDLNDDFGIVVSVRDAFGFIQPLLKEDQLYFSFRDMRSPASEINPGDLVRFRERSSARGPTADNIRLVPAAPATSLSGSVTGTITREPDSNRRVPGVVTVTSHALVDARGNNITSPPQHMAFVPSSLDSFFSSRCNPLAGKSSPSGSRGGGLKRMIKGDEVTFECVHMPSTAFYIGFDAKVTRTKKEMQFAAQIQRMLDAGAVQEVGIVETVKGDYGFLKPRDRKEQIYFRLSDVIVADDAGGSAPTIEAGVTEVSFFVIMESIKGSMSDRAVHLQLLPRGTVQFEATLGEKVKGVVIREPIVRSNSSSSTETPGAIRLVTPISKSGGSGASNNHPSEIREVELWQRCIPDALTLRVGDLVSVDVTHYRPENLMFARNLKIVAYRSVGREVGIVKNVRGQAGYGFVNSTIRDFDLYFRTGECVSSTTGSLVRDRDIEEGMTVTFDVEVDTSSATATYSSSSPSAMNSGNNAPPKLRGVRVMILSPEEAKQRLRTTYLVREGVEGIIQRDAKKDAVGIIRVTSSASDGSIETTHSQPQTQHSHTHMINNIELLSCPPDILASLEEFRYTPSELQEANVEHLPTTQRKFYQRALDHINIHAHSEGKDYTHTLCYDSATDTQVASAKDGSKLVCLHIWKPKSQEEYDEWAAKHSKLHSQSQARTSHTSTHLSDDSQHQQPHMLANKKLSSVHFQKADVVCDFLTKEMEVSFNLHIDLKSGNFVAKGVQLTDKPCESDSSLISAYTRAYTQAHLPQNASIDDGYHVGVIQVITHTPSSKAQSRFGFIRVIPTSQKLFWHESYLSPVAGSSEANGSSVFEGQEVSFQMRLRGGLPCAVNITPLPVGSLSQPALLPGECVCVVVEEDKVVVVDASQCAPLANHFWDGCYDSAFSSVGVATASSSSGEEDVDNEPSAESGAAAAGASGTATTAAVAPTANKRAPKYFDLLHRQPLDLHIAPEALAALQPLHPGELFYAQCVVNWQQSAQPLYVAGDGLRRVTSVLSLRECGNVVCVRKCKGIIVRTKIKHAKAQTQSQVQAQIDSSSNNSFHTLELCEIKESSRGPTLWASSQTSTDETQASSSSNAFYVDTKEISKSLNRSNSSSSSSSSAGSASSGIQLGDPVDYYAVWLAKPGQVLVVGATVTQQPAQQQQGAGAGAAAAPVDMTGINFKRNVNITLREANVKQGFKGIVMAKGPENEQDLGFVAGWREPIQTASLPWAHLLVSDGR